MSAITLARDTNQALGIGRYAVDFFSGKLGEPDESVLARVELFHLDSIACAVSAIARGTSAPNLLRQEALEYPRDDPRRGAALLGEAGGWRLEAGGREDSNPEPQKKRSASSSASSSSSSLQSPASGLLVAPEKAVLANCAAAREWDANGTNFGYNPARGATAGEFGHNDFYPVAVAAAQMRGLNGRQTLLGMLLLDEIRGRLAEVFSLKDHKIDHVVHGAIASAATYGAMLGATPEQIESAIGLVVAHYIPFRAIRAGKQLSDSKGASAAISAEVAVVAMQRAMRGFIGPADVFRNPQAIFCLFEPPAEKNCSPFDLTLSTAGEDFAVMGMHFKLGLYEHQSAGAIQGLMELLAAHPGLLDDPVRLKSVRITTYEPAFSIIGDPAKRDPRTRQSADHSMVYIVGTLLRKAKERLEAGGWRLEEEGWRPEAGGWRKNVGDQGRDAAAALRSSAAGSLASLPPASRLPPAALLWRELILLPADYDAAALVHPLTRAFMDKIEFRHGGPEYDARYPDGIPTTIEIEHAELGRLSSGLVMYPEGHARCASGNLLPLLSHKFQRLAALGVQDVAALQARFSGLAGKSAEEIARLFDFPLDAPAGD